jgi:hypothetical protein
MRLVFHPPLPWGSIVNTASAIAMPLATFSTADCRLAKIQNYKRANIGTALMAAHPAAKYRRIYLRYRPSNFIA